VRVVAVAFVLALCNCSYSTSFDDCQIICRSPDECPNGLTCGTEGLCRTSNANQTCSSSKADASPPGTCSGDPTLCSAITMVTDCNKQDGCSFSTPLCSNVTNCRGYMVSTACTQDPACFFDSSVPTCKTKTDFCVATNLTACESKTGCKFSGGCTGTARLCTGYATQATCVNHAGCSWN
jgi:hypothetical protein